MISSRQKVYVSATRRCTPGRWLNSKGSVIVFKGAIESLTLSIVMMPKDTPLALPSAGDMAIPLLNWSAVRAAVAVTTASWLALSPTIRTLTDWDA